jgi:hypothetical protein
MKYKWECSGSEEDYGDDWRAIEACAEWDAAEKFAERRNQRDAEYPDEQEVRVKRKDGTIATFIVSLESRPHYTAREKA